MTSLPLGRGEVERCLYMASRDDEPRATEHRLVSLQEEAVVIFENGRFAKPGWTEQAIRHAQPRLDVVGCC